MGTWARQKETRTYYNLPSTLRSSCDIENFVETHTFCKLCMLFRSHVLLIRVRTRTVLENKCSGAGDTRTLMWHHDDTIVVYNPTHRLLYTRQGLEYSSPLSFISDSNFLRTSVPPKLSLHVHLSYSWAYCTTDSQYPTTPNKKSSDKKGRLISAGR